MRDMSASWSGYERNMRYSADGYSGEAIENASRSMQ